MSGLPWTIAPARSTRPPSISVITWWPRHTPSTGSRPWKCSITAREMPASAGVPGPGETTTWVGSSASASAIVMRSLRATCTSAPAVAM